MHKISITKVLICICVITTLLRYIFPALTVFGMNSYFLEDGNYSIYAMQMVMYSFLHGGLAHIFMNSLFLYYFGSGVEMLIGRKKYFIFFVFVTVFDGILLTLVAGDQNTIGISGFCMAILSYYVLELKRLNNPEYKGGITAIVLNIAVGFLPGISLYGHLFGVIAGVIYYYLNKEYMKPRMVGKVLNE